MDILSYLNRPLLTGAAAAPQPWGSRIGLFGAALKDVGSSLSGNPQDAQNVAMFQQEQQQRTAAAAANTAKAALQAALATGDRTKIQQAMMGYVGAGGDPTGFINALKFGRPEVQNLGDGTLASIDPFTGQASVALQGPRKPLVNGGMTSMDNGKTWQAIPGYVDQQSAIYNARDAAAAAHRAPPKAKPTVPGQLSPWLAFGGQ